MQVRFCPIGRTLDTSFSRKQLGRRLDVPFYVQATSRFSRAVEDKEKNDAGNSDPVDESNKGDNKDSPSGDKGKSHDNSEEGKEGDGGESDKNNDRHNVDSSKCVNGLDMECAADDLCKMKGAPISEPRHKCMNCRNQMHGGVCGVQWSDRGVDQIDISIGKYPSVPFFFTRLFSLSLSFWYSSA